MKKLSKIFLVVFCFSLIGQLVVSQYNDFTDQVVWEKRIEQFRSDFISGNFDAYNPIYSGHPGTPTLMVGAAFRQLSLTPSASLQLGVGIISSLAIAGATIAAASLRPDSIWWVMVPSLATFHPLLLRASPTNAVAASLSLFVVIWALWLHKKRSHPHSREVLLWGIAIGALAATRLPTAILIAGPFLILLISRIGLPVAGTALISSLSSAILLDPLLWFAPIDHLSFILFRSSLNLTDAVPTRPLTLEDFFLFAPLTLLSIALVIITYFYKRPAPFPRSAIATLIITTGLFSLVFLNVHAQSLRHFLPLIFVWEILLIQIIIHLFDSSALLTESKNIYKKISIGVLVLGQAFLLLYVLWL